MARKYIDIGPLKQVAIYDDAVTPEAIKTDGVVEAATFVGVGGSSGVTGTFTVVSSIQAGGGGGIGLQYRTRLITVTSGLITAIGAESGWSDL